jgi:carbamoyl-phosphate synthase large subunit
VKCIIPRERIEVRAGEISKGRTVKNAIIPFLKEKLGYIEGCVGCICVQLFFHPEHQDIIGIDINPRFGGGYPLSYMSGGNFPELLIREYLLDEEIEYFDNWKDNLLMLRFDDAVYI